MKRIPKKYLGIKTKWLKNEIDNHGHKKETLLQE
jgi:hypothetical protein